MTETGVTDGNERRIADEVSRQLPWLRLHLVTRDLLDVTMRFTPEVKQALQRCAALRQILIDSGMFN